MHASPARNSSDALDISVGHRTQLKSNGLAWRLTGRAVARQCLIERGLLPVLAAPSPSGAPQSYARGPNLFRPHGCCRWSSEIRLQGACLGAIHAVSCDSGHPF